jgi:hypothetical protein
MHHFSFVRVVHYMKETHFFHLSTCYSSYIHLLSLSFSDVLSQYVSGICMRSLLAMTFHMHTDLLKL